MNLESQAWVAAMEESGAWLILCMGLGLGWSCLVLLFG